MFLTTILYKNVICVVNILQLIFWNPTFFTILNSSVAFGSNIWAPPTALRADTGIDRSQREFDIAFDYLCLSRSLIRRENAADDHFIANECLRGIRFPKLLPLSFTSSHTPFLTTSIICRAMERLQGIDERIPLLCRANLRFGIHLPPNRVASNKPLFASLLLPGNRFDSLSLSFFSLTKLFRASNKFFFTQRNKLNINVG